MSVSQKQSSEKITFPDVGSGFQLDRLRVYPYLNTSAGFALAAFEWGHVLVTCPLNKKIKILVHIYSAKEETGFKNS